MHRSTYVHTHLVHDLQGPTPLTVPGGRLPNFCFDLLQEPACSRLGLSARQGLSSAQCCSGVFWTLYQLMRARLKSYHLIWIRMTCGPRTTRFFFPLFFSRLLSNGYVHTQLFGVSFVHTVSGSTSWLVRSILAHINFQGWPFAVVLETPCD